MRTRKNQYPENDVNIPNPRTTRSNHVSPTIQLTPVNQEAQTVASQPDKVEENLRKLYGEIKAAPSFSAKINEFLRKHELHSKFRRIIKKKFPRRKIVARFPFEIFMADLIEYPKFKVINKGYVYILLLIDCFTRKIYIAPMKKKDQTNSALAFESILKTFIEFPKNLVTDGGKEFFNSSVSKIFQNYGINHYKTPTKTKWKASMAERVIRTIKGRLQKYFTKNKRNIWIDVIDQVVQNYNATPHSTHGLPPQDVTDENRDEVYKRLYPDKNITTVCKLKKGDKVRILKEKTEFEKGYTQKWSDEIYRIKIVRQSGGVCWYKIEDHTSTEIQGIWYYYQLNLVVRNAN